MQTTFQHPFPLLMKPALRTHAARVHRMQPPRPAQRAIKRFKSSLLFNVLTTAAVLAVTAAAGWSGSAAFASIHRLLT